FSFTFGADLQRLSADFGSSTAMAANSIWCLALGAGFVANALYCAYLLRRNHSWHVFGDGPVSLYWIGVAGMGVLGFGGIVGYGVGAAWLGALGGIVGWPLLMSMTVVAANVWGAITGEWKGARRRSLSYWCAGLATLLLAIYVISLGGSA